MKTIIWISLRRPNSVQHPQPLSLPPEILKSAFLVNSNKSPAIETGTSIAMTRYAWLINRLKGGDSETSAQAPRLYHNEADVTHVGLRQTASAAPFKA